LELILGLFWGELGRLCKRSPQLFFAAFSEDFMKVIFFGCTLVVSLRVTRHSLRDQQMPLDCMHRQVFFLNEV
jgi:hypothetical protein